MSDKAAQKRAALFCYAPKSNETAPARKHTIMASAVTMGPMKKRAVPVTVVPSKPQMPAWAGLTAGEVNFHRAEPVDFLPGSPKDGVAPAPRPGR